MSSPNPQRIFINNLYLLSNEDRFYVYKFGNHYVDASDLQPFPYSLSPDVNVKHIPDFNVNYPGSDIIILELDNGQDHYQMIYQFNQNGQLMGLTPRPSSYKFYGDVTTLRVPLPSFPFDPNRQLPELQLWSVDDDVIMQLESLRFDHPMTNDDFNSILNIRTQPKLTIPDITRIYGSPATGFGYPENFTLLDEVGRLIQNNQIFGYRIDPILQPWAGPGNTILTITLKTSQGILVKARYNPQTNQIFPPI